MLQKLKSLGKFCVQSRPVISPEVIYILAAVSSVVLAALYSWV